MVAPNEALKLAIARGMPRRLVWASMLNGIVAALERLVKAKVSTGQAVDLDEDYDLDVWAGILPLTTVPGEPISDPLLKDGVPTPGYISGWRRPSSPG